MPARSLFHLGLVFALASCAVTAATPPAAAPPPGHAAPVVRGRVLDDEGRPLAAASVRRFGRDGRVDAVVATDREGRFSVPVDPGAGIVKLHVTGLVRKSESFVVTTDALPLDVVVKLGSYDEISATLEGVEVLVADDRTIGGIRDVKTVADGLDFDAKSPDGSYRFYLSTADGQKQLLADGMFEVANGKAHVPFDRAHVPPAGRKGSVELPPGSAARAVNDMIWLAASETERLTAPPQKRAPALSWSVLRETTARVAVTDARPRVRSAALVAHFVGGTTFPTPEDRALAYALVKDVAPADPLWSIASPVSLASQTPSPFENVVNVAGVPLDDPFVRSFVTEQPDITAVSRFLFLEMMRAKNAPERQRVIVEQSRAPRLRESAFSAQIARLDPDRPFSAGKPAPVIDVASLDGKGHVGSASFAGKPYLIDIWSTSCGPCVTEQPLLHHLYAAYAKGGKLGMLSIVADDDAATVAKFRADPAHPMPWKHGTVNHAETFALFAKLGAASPSFPFHLLVDAKGMIVDASPSLRSRDLDGLVARMSR